MYKILSLDGGGSWALLQILTLKERYPDPEITGWTILKEYDLVIANSGGSMVLAALASDWTLDKCLELFDKAEIRDSIFKKSSFWDRYFPTNFLAPLGFGPKYSTTGKYKGLSDIFKEIKSLKLHELVEKIGEGAPHMAVVTFDAINNKAKFFRSYEDEDEEFDEVNLVQAIHGSSNAPVNYFDFPARIKANGTEKWYYLWDGALGGFNNPVAAGMVEALNLGVKKEHIAIVSLGTSNKIISERERKYFYKLYINVLKNRRWKLRMGAKFFMKTVVNQAKTILYEPPDWASYVAYVLRFDYDLKNTEENATKFVRLSPLIHALDEFDDATKELVYQLHALDMDLTCDEDIQLIKECFKAWKEGRILNQPIKTSFDKNETIKYKCGRRYFQEAFQDWQRL